MTQLLEFRRAALKGAVKGGIVGETKKGRSSGLAGFFFFRRENIFFQLDKLVRRRKSSVGLRSFEVGGVQLGANFEYFLVRHYKPLLTVHFHAKEFFCYTLYNLEAEDQSLGRR